MRTPSLYAHVDGLQDVRRRLGTCGATDLAEILSRAAIGRARGDALAAGAAPTAPMRTGTPARTPPRSAHPIPAAAARVVDILRALLHGYGLDGDDAVHAIRAVRCAMHGFVALEDAGGFGMPASTESFQRLIAMLDAGLHTAGGKPAAAG